MRASAGFGADHDISKHANLTSLPAEACNAFASRRPHGRRGL